MLLAVGPQVGLDVQIRARRSTFAVLAAALKPLAPLVRAQAIGVVVFATIGEITGSLVWGVYHYRLHNLPLFIPPAHGLVYLNGLAPRGAYVPERPLIRRSPPSARAASGEIARRGRSARRLDASGAFGVPLRLRLPPGARVSTSAAPPTPIFLVVAALELYGTSIGTWRWAAILTKSSASRTETRRAALRAATSGSTSWRCSSRQQLVYVDGGTQQPKLSLFSGALRSSIRRTEPSGTMSASGASSRASAT